jgi:DNA-binding beta-propeller fold protein YncE
VGEHPIDVAVGEGSVWVLDRDGSVRRIDPVSNRAAVIRKVAEDPRAIAAGEGWIWVADGTKEVVHRIDPASNRLASSIQVGAVAHDVAADSNGVWAAAGSGIVRIDPSSGDVVALQGTVGGEAGGLAPKARYKTGAGGGFVWQISQLFPKVARFDVAGDRFDVLDIDVAPRVIAVSRTDVWLATCGAPGMVIRLDARAGEVTATVAAGGSTCSDLVTGRPIAIAADDAGAWVTDGVNGTISRINATTNQVDLPTRVGDTPTAVAVGLGSVWVTVDGTSG